MGFLEPRLRAAQGRLVACAVAAGLFLRSPDARGRLVHEAGGVIDG